MTTVFQRRAATRSRPDRAWRHGGRVPRHRHTHRPPRGAEARFDRRRPRGQQIARGGARGRDAAGAVRPRAAGMCRRCTSTAPTARTSSSRWSSSTGRTCPRSSPQGRCRPHARVRHRDPDLRVPRGRRHASTARSTGAPCTRCCTATSSRGTSASSTDDEIKVFDFGIAKALSLSRKVTRNDFGSIAYLSPERIESGDIDAQAEFWAVGVLLYEMVSGVQPFRAADTRRLEQRIRARRPPPALDDGVPRGPAGDHRQAAAPARRRPLRQRDRDSRGSAALSAGEPTLAEREGWPARAARRTGDAADAPCARTPETERGHTADRPMRVRRRSAAAYRRPRIAPARGTPAAVEAPAPPVAAKPRRSTWRRARAALQWLRDPDGVDHHRERDTHLHRRQRAGADVPQDLDRRQLRRGTQYEALIDGASTSASRRSSARWSRQTIVLADDVIARLSDRDATVCEAMAAGARCARATPSARDRRTGLAGRAALLRGPPAPDRRRSAHKARSRPAERRSTSLPRRSPRSAKRPSCGRTGPIRSSA